MQKLLTIIMLCIAFSLSSQYDSPSTIFMDVDTPAIYTGGSAALQRHLSNYSNELRTFFPGGTLLLISFIVEPDGSISNVTPVNAQISREVLEIIEKMFSTMDAWKPAVVNGKRIRSKNFVTLEL